jgi:hypothetical protein
MIPFVELRPCCIAVNRPSTSGPLARCSRRHGIALRLPGLSGARDEIHLAAIVQNLKMLVACSANDRRSLRMGCVAFHHNGASGAWGRDHGRGSKKVRSFRSYRSQTEDRDYSVSFRPFFDTIVPLQTLPRRSEFNPSSVDHIVGTD